MFLDRLQASRAWVAWGCAAAGWAFAWPSAAQTTPVVATPTPTAELTPSERAQRDADKVFKWILIHSDKPRKTSVAREQRREERPAVAIRQKPTARAGEPAPAVAAAPAPAFVAMPPAAPSLVPVVAASPAVQSSLPLADVPSAVTPQLEIALAPPSSAATRVAPPSLPAPVDDGDEILRPLVRTEPRFPPSVLRTLTKGQIRVGFTVLPDGSVAEASVVKTSDPRLRPAVLAAIAQWRFAPLRKAQNAVVDLVFDPE